MAGIANTSNVPRIHLFTYSQIQLPGGQFIVQYFQDMYFLLPSACCLLPEKKQGG